MSSGNLPNSDLHAKLLLFLETPRVFLQNWLCVISIGDVSFNFSVPQISQPYNRMGLTQESNILSRLSGETDERVRHLKLCMALRALFDNCFLANEKVPDDVMVIPR